MINGLNKVRRGIASFSLVMIIAGFFAVSVAQAATFSDVQPSDWFSPYVEQLAADGILNTTTGTYRPADLVNRAEMAKLAVEAFKLTLENPETPTFKDVPKGSWFYQYVETAAKNGIVGGYKDQTGTLTGYFGPGDSLTREQAMKILVLAAPLTTNTKGGPHFSDVPASAWSYEYVETGYNWSVVDGYADGSFNPTKNINRAEIAKMVVNAMNPVVREGSAGYEISSVTALNATTVEVCYSVEVDATAAADKANYSIKDSSNSVLAVDSATVSADGMCVELATGTQTAAMVYNLLITGVKSTADEELITNSIGFNGYSTNANGGDLTVSADDSTPTGVTLPGAVSGVPVFTFDVAAGTNDVNITSIEIHRGGTGVDASVANVAIFDESNRVSKAKTFNTSTDTATVSLLSGGLTVKAGTTKKLSVVATIGTSAAAAGSEFYLEVAKVGAIASNAKTINGTFPVIGKTFKVGSTDSGVITWLDNGKPSDPKLGATAAEVSKFKLRNESNDNDMLLSAVTLKENTSSINADTELANWSLWIEGTKVAETAKSSNRYVTFKLSPSYTIKSSKTVSVVVKADVVGGAGKTIGFSMDNSLDLSATDTKFGYGAKVCYSNTDATCILPLATYNPTGTTYETTEVVTVQAGEVSIVSVNATSTDILKNKKNVVAGTLKVTTKAGLNLELQKFNVLVTNSVGLTTPGACGAGYDPDLECLIENVELYDVKTGSVYDLTTSTANAMSKTYGDNSLTIPLAAGETREFQVRFDTLNRTINTAKLSFAVQNIGSTGFYLVETGDNKAVTDITPASVTFKDLNGVAADATITVLTQSLTKTAVVGTKEVEVLSAQIDAGNASKLTMSEFKVFGNYVDAPPFQGGSLVAINYATNKSINALRLYKVEGTTKTLLSEKSGSLLASGNLTFDNMTQEIALNGSLKLLVTADFVDDSSNNTDTVRFGIESLRLVDYDNDDIANASATSCDAGTSLLNLDSVGPGKCESKRLVTIAPTGALTVATKNDDTAVNYAKNITGGATSDFVGAFQFTATNEGVKIVDLQVVGAGANYVSDVSEVILYKADKTTEIARKSVTGTTTTFTNLNYVVQPGSEIVYVKVVANPIGLNLSGTGATDHTLTLAFPVSKVEGNDSGKVITPTLNGVVPGTLDLTNTFMTYPVKVSSVSFVNTATVNGVTETVSSTNQMTTGASLIGIVAVGTDAQAANQNLEADGKAVKTMLKTFNFTPVTTGAVVGYTVTRLGGTGTAWACAAGTCVLPASGAAGYADRLIDNGTIAYYLVKTTSSGPAASSAQVTFGTLNTQITYDTEADLLTDAGVRMAANTLNGPVLEYKP